jgi:histidine triad (HIT) family protein|tara:strand:+ start:1937 stop:2359 length:423 start_codon:yes stop_codon:yes gene_type:complete
VSEETIFSLILDNKIPCHKIYEDNLVLAFLDINPFSPGHTLVIPKEKASTLDKLSDDSAAAIGRVLPRISNAILKVVGAKEFNIIQNNGINAFQTVFHVHFHIIPKFDDGRGLQYPFKSSPINHDEATIMADRLSKLLSN